MALPGRLHGGDRPRAAAQLTGLKVLNLTGCTGVTDLGPLRGLTGLEWLNLTGCTGVTDLGPLRGLTGLNGSPWAAARG